MEDSLCCTVYSYWDAPAELRAACSADADGETTDLRGGSCHGGDEDWLIVFPSFGAYDNGPHEVIEKLTVCGTCKHTMPDGRYVVICAHA